MLSAISSLRVSSTTVHSSLSWLISRILYLHAIKYPWWRCLWRPETLGFSAERVYPFILETYGPDMRGTYNSPDKEKIFAWQILPIEKEAQSLEHIEILRKDQSARVIIYCIPNLLPG